MNKDDKEKTTLGIVGEVGMFGSLNMQDPSVQAVNELIRKTNDPNLKAYLEENMKERQK